MKHKTPEEVARQVEGLKKEKVRLPEISGLGTDNWAIIDAQLDVLEGKKVSNDFWQDESAEEYVDGDNDAYHEAVQAELWLTGDRKADLFDPE